VILPREKYVINDKEVTDLEYTCREGEVVASRILYIGRLIGLRVHTCFCRK
jgi:hypothetical protein